MVSNGIKIFNLWPLYKGSHIRVWIGPILVRFSQANGSPSCPAPAHGETRGQPWPNEALPTPLISPIYVDNNIAWPIHSWSKQEGTFLEWLHLQEIVGNFHIFLKIFFHIFCYNIYHTLIISNLQRFF